MLLAYFQIALKLTFSCVLKPHAVSSAIGGSLLAYSPGTARYSTTIVALVSGGLQEQPRMAPRSRAEASSYAGVRAATCSDSTALQAYAGAWKDPVPNPSFNPDPDPRRR